MGGAREGKRCGMGRGMGGAREGKRCGREEGSDSNRINQCTLLKWGNTFIFKTYSVLHKCTSHC